MNIHTTPVNMATFVRHWAERLSSKRAVVFPHGRDGDGRVSYTHLTFRQLEEESNRYARGLQKLGVRRGMRTALMLTPSLEFFAVTFALFKLGAVVVLIDPGIGIHNLGKC
ncbi:MAG TPA: AMP-binding protein, partial [Candidatus Ozemobacteraceae bacterium]|nr:AMP-binding protein [Candidatus Ozemobacteraceae bacterium]